jgi:hypothetical protein
MDHAMSLSERLKRFPLKIPGGLPATVQDRALSKASGVNAPEHFPLVLSRNKLLHL